MVDTEIWWFAQIFRVPSRRINTRCLPVNLWRKIFTVPKPAPKGNDFVFCVSGISATLAKCIQRKQASELHLVSCKGERRLQVHSRTFLAPFFGPWIEAEQSCTLHQYLFTSNKNTIKSRHAITHSRVCHQVAKKDRQKVLENLDLIFLARLVLHQRWQLSHRRLVISVNFLFLLRGHITLCLQS